MWKKNDHTFREFILKHISVDDYQRIIRLEKCHEFLGIYAQAALFKRAFDILRYDTPLSETASEIELINEQIVKMGTSPIQAICTFIVNALGDNPSRLRICASDIPQNTAYDELDQPHQSSWAGNKNKDAKATCSDCKRSKHRGQNVWSVDQGGPYSTERCIEKIHAWAKGSGRSGLTPPRPLQFPPSCPCQGIHNSILSPPSP